MAATQAIKEIFWLQKLFKDIEFLEVSPMTIINNNKSYIFLLKNLMFYSYTMHIEIQHYFICENIKNDKSNLIFCKT